MKIGEIRVKFFEISSLMTIFSAKGIDNTELNCLILDNFEILEKENNKIQKTINPRLIELENIIQEKGKEVNAQHDDSILLLSLDEQKEYKILQAKLQKDFEIERKISLVEIKESIVRSTKGIPMNSLITLKFFSQPNNWKQMKTKKENNGSIDDPKSPDSGGATFPPSK